MCLDKECLEEYKEKLEKGLVEYMKMPAAQKTAEAVKSMFEAMDLVDEMLSHKEELTDETIEHWMHNLKNTDGTTGRHWTIPETTSLGVPDEVSEPLWNAIVNMMYSDYYRVAEEYGVNTPEFYVEMARAFIEDEDAVPDKLTAYYNYIVQ